MPILIKLRIVGIVVFVRSYKYKKGSSYSFINSKMTSDEMRRKILKFDDVSHLSLYLVWSFPPAPPQYERSERGGWRETPLIGLRVSPVRDSEFPT